jgi:chorismate mutase / prephenate dehydratase
MKELQKHRSQIDRIDAQIVKLLHARAENSVKIAKIKNGSNAEIYDPARENQVLKKLRSGKKGKFPAKGIESVYNEIFSVSRALQRRVCVAYFGPKASYTHQAAMSRFGKQADYMPAASIRDVFMEVEKNNAEYGCVPIENSTEGAINYTYDMFADSDLKIYSEVMLEIKHNLLSKEKSMSKIKAVYSHPQSLAQCRGWLEENLPGVPLKEVSSNSRAAEIAASQKNTAAIAGELAAEVYSLGILASAIQDMADNTTRFFILGKSFARRTGADKTSIMVSIKDKVGALYSLLKPFSKHKVNLTNIESRPSKKKAWDYFFFVDFAGHIEEPRVKRALAEVEKSCGSVKILGSYPRF